MLRSGRRGILVAVRSLYCRKLILLHTDHVQQPVDLGLLLVLQLLMQFSQAGLTLMMRVCGGQREGPPTQTRASRIAPTARLELAGGWHTWIVDVGEVVHQ